MANTNENTLKISGGTSPATEDILSSLTDTDIGSLLQFLAQKANIDLGDAKLEMKRREKEKTVLSVHPYKITNSNEKWMTYIKDDTKKEKRKKVVKNSREELIDALFDHYKHPGKKAITLERIFPEWLRFKGLHVAETYVSRLETAWNKYYDGTKITTVPLKSLTKLRLDEWIHALIKKHNLTKTEYFNMSIIMRQCLDYAVEKDYIKENLFRKVHVDGRRVFRRTPKKRSSSQVFTDDEVKQIYEYAMRDYKSGDLIYELSPLAVIFMFQTGLRISEVCALRYEDVEEDRIHVQRMYQRDTKKVLDRTKGTFQDRYVFLTPESRKIINLAKRRQWERGVSADGYIFSVNDEPCSCSSIAQRFRNYCKWMGTEHKSSHKARKTFVSAALDGGINLNTVREAVGHQDERTTLQSYLYDRSGDEEVKTKFADVIDRIHVG